MSGVMGFLNGYIKVRVLWFGDTGSVDLTDSFVSVSSNEDFDPNNNSCNLVLFDSDVFYNSLGNFLVQENDRFIIWGKEVVDNSDLEFSDLDIIWDGKFVDFSRSVDSGSRALTLTLMDSGYDFFNRFWSRNYSGLGLRTNEIVLDILSNVGDNPDGSGFSVIDVSNVANVRGDGSGFPVISPTFAGKPVYEWINELSNPDFTNTSSELASDPVVSDAMVFRFKGDKAYWYEPSEVALTIDGSIFLDSISYSSNNEESINFLILEAGEDFFGEPIFTYVNDPSSTSEVQKDRYETQQRISGRNNEYDNQFHLLRRDYDESSNTEFRREVRDLARSFADTWFRLFGRERKTVSVTLPYVSIELGDFVYINLKRFKKVNYRVVEKSVSLNNNSFFVTLELEEVLD